MDNSQMTEEKSVLQILQGEVVKLVIYQILTPEDVATTHRYIEAGFASESSHPYLSNQGDLT